MSKKIFAFVMALALVLTFMPVTSVYQHAEAAETECNHSWKNYQGICTKCGAQHAHTGCMHQSYKWKCSVCNYETMGEIPDYYPEDGHCDACKELFWPEKHPDEMKYDAEYHWLDCEVCAEKTKGKHTLVDNKCNCGYEFVCEHLEEKYVSDGNGKHTTVCVDCGANTLFDYYFECTDLEENVCTKCGYEKYHFPGTEATCTEAAVCKHCGKSYGDKLGHDWENSVCQREGCGVECDHDWKNYEGVCDECGARHTHTTCGWYGDPGADDDLLCDICGYDNRAQHPDFVDAEGNPGPDGHCDCCGGCFASAGVWTKEYDATHHWDKHDCGQIDEYSIEEHDFENGYCAECDYICEHTDEDGICNEKPVCDICGETYGEKLDHDWKDGECQREGCGVKCDHDWKNLYGICDVCGDQHAHDACNGGKCSICKFTHEKFTHPDYYPQDYHCDACEAHLGYGENPVKKFDATHHWYECVCGDYIWGNDEEGDTKEEHTFDANGFCAWCEYQCDHEEFVFVHIEGTEAYKSMHDWLCPDCGYVLVNDALCYNKDENGDGICDGCKYEYDHNTHVAEKQPATCTEPAVCDACGKSFGEANGHGEYVYEHIEGTVDKGSKHKATCEDCGEVIFIEWYCSDDDEDNFCDECGVQLHTHDWSNKDGVCVTCGEACEHANDYDVISNGKGQHMLECPDCGNNFGGMLLNCENYDTDYDGVCNSCGYEIYHNWSDRDGECNNCGEKCEHNEEDKVISNGKGQHSLECPVCGYTYGDVLLNCDDRDGDRFCDSCGYEVYHLHDWSNKDGICVGCGEECEHDVVNAISNGKGQHSLECAECGYTYGDMLLNCENYDSDYDGVCNSCEYEIYHTGGTPTCTEPAKCQHCGEEYVEALGHKYEVVKSEPATCGLPAYFWYECSVCGAEKNGEEGAATGEHTYEVVKSEPATCVLPAYYWYECSVCGAEKNGEEGAATGEHKYEVVKSEPATCTMPAYYWYECAECGAEMNREEGEATGLHVDVTNDGKCDACGFVMRSCDHEGTGTYTFTVEANCSNEGLVQVFCAECEELLSEEVLAKNDNHFFYNGKCVLCGEIDECKHDYVLVKSEAPTCVLPGYYWYECSKCGAEKNGEDTTGALAAHKYEVVKSEPATCVLPAYYWYECSVCGAEKNGEEGAATGEHKYEVVKSEPATCTMPAYYWYECAECGAEMNREEGAADKTAHTYEVVKSEPATCILPAYYWYECAECGAEKNGEEGKATGMHVDANNDGKCDTCDYLFFIPCDHEGTGTYIITVEANCSNEGIVQVFCAECEELISEEILAKNDNHFFYNGKCMLCGEADECKHDFVLVKEEAATCEYPAYYWYECSKCGEEKNYEDKTGALAAHKYEVVKSEPATCEVPAYFWYECSVCGAEKNGEDKTGKLGEHDYVVVKELDATCTELGYVWKECSVCGAEKNHEVPGELGEHNYEVVKTEPATCEAPAYFWYECTVCGAEKNYEDKTGALADHAWDEGKVTTEPTVEAEGVKTFTCTVCGETKTEAIDKIEKPEHVHDYKSVVTAPTCTEAGYTTFTCECGDSYVDDEVAAKGHTAVETGKVAATCTTAGKEADTECSVCGITLSEGAVIAALGHKEVSANNAVEATCTTAGKKADTVCSVCGITLAEGAAIGAKGHNEVSANNAVEATCDTNGKKADTVCSECGETLAKGAVIEATGHKYGKASWDFNHDGTMKVRSYTCGVCGHVDSTVMPL